MLGIVDSLKKIQNHFQSGMAKDIHDYFTSDSAFMFKTPYSQASGELLLYRVQDRVNAAWNIITSDVSNIETYRERIDSYMVEVHKKYSIPFACIVFVLIGAPLGIMTRRGGMGVAAGISVIFFLIYWAFLIGGEKFADRGLISPFWGMWSANFVLGILGILLTVKSARETVTLNLSFLSKLVPRQLRAPQEENEDN
jgi:lipopolysaccharide export system permease protein